MKNFIAESEKCQIVNEYKNGKSNKELSIKYNVHRTTIQKILKLNNVSLRKRSSSLLLNKDFFSKYTKENCYWAGFILADGYIRNGRNCLSIKLTNKDELHLEKFKQIIEAENLKINKHREYCEISICVKKIIEDLKNNFEIYNKKSLTCYISKKIPKHLLSHFIRGYYDGDGCITVTTCPTVSIVGTEKTLQQISEFFKNCNVKFKTKNKTIPSIVKNKNCYSISYYGTAASQVLKIIYNQSNEHNRLSRKYIKYQKLFK